MLSDPALRNWISLMTGAIIVCGIFGYDLLHVHFVGTAGDVGLIMGAVSALGIHASFVAGVNSAKSAMAAAVSAINK